MTWFDIIKVEDVKFDSTDWCCSLVKSHIAEDGKKMIARYYITQMGLDWLLDLDCENLHQELEGGPEPRRGQDSYYKKWLKMWDDCSDGLEFNNFMR